ncbi:MAG: SWIM zinc finger family protein [Gemmataceae bacterium]
MWYREFYEPSRPRAVKGGIKAQSKQGAFGTSWWAKRWIAVLEGFNIGARLGRGRSYARKGQVVSIDIEPGRVTAEVQGSRPTPYEVAIEIPTLTAKEWDKLVAVLGEQAAFAAKLLAGEMPTDIETAFAKAGLSLFPRKLSEIATDCSCPDWSNPCKHVAAVYYLIGEEFDRDPFLLFRLRGLDRDALCQRLAAAGPATPREAAAPEEPLPADPAAFWAAPEVPADLATDARLPPVSAALPKRLGHVPFWRGEERFLDAMAGVYPAAARAALARLEATTAVTK